MRVQDQFGDTVSTDDLCPLPSIVDRTDDPVPGAVVAHITQTILEAVWYEFDNRPGALFVRRSEVGDKLELEDPLGDLANLVDAGGALFRISLRLNRWNYTDGFHYA